MVVVVCDILCDVLLAITFDKTASVVVGCVHEVNQQQGGSKDDHYQNHITDGRRGANDDRRTVSPDEVDKD